MSCGYKHTEAYNSRVFREKNTDPHFELILNIAVCEREINHEGDHTGESNSLSKLIYSWETLYKDSGNALYVSLKEAGKL